MAQGMQDLVTLSQAMSSFAQSVNTLYRARVEAETGKYLIQRSRAQAEFLNSMNKMEINDDNWETEFGKFRDQMSAQIDSIKDEKVRYGVAKRVVPLDDEFMVQLSNKYASIQVAKINYTWDESIAEAWSQNPESLEENESLFKSTNEMIRKQLLNSLDREKKMIENERRYKVNKLYIESMSKVKEKRWAGSAPVSVETEREIAPYEAVMRINAGEFEEKDGRVISTTVQALQDRQKAIDESVKQAAKLAASNASTIDVQGLYKATDDVTESMASPEAKAEAVGEIDRALDKQFEEEIRNAVMQSAPAGIWSKRTKEDLTQLKQWVQNIYADRESLSKIRKEMIALIDSWLEKGEDGANYTKERNWYKDTFWHWVDIYRARGINPETGATMTATDLATYIKRIPKQYGLHEELTKEVDRRGIYDEDTRKFFELLDQNPETKSLMDDLSGDKRSRFSWINEMKQDERHDLLRQVVSEVETDVRTGMFKTKDEIVSAIKGKLVGYAVAKDVWGKSLTDGVTAANKAAQRLAPIVAASDEREFIPGSVNRYGNTNIAPELGGALKGAPEAFRNFFMEKANTPEFKPITLAEGKGSGQTLAQKFGINLDNMTYKTGRDEFDAMFVGKDSSGNDVKVTVDSKTVGSRTVTILNVWKAIGKKGEWQFIGEMEQQNKPGKPKPPPASRGDGGSKPKTSEIPGSAK